MPLLAAIAVALCTAMVLIVWSVMGGFLTMLLAQGSSVIGDVAVANPVVGFPYYDEFIEELEARPEIEAATPTIESLGLLAVSSDTREGLTPRVVQVIGVRPGELNQVTEFKDRLWWRPLGEEPDASEESVDWRKKPTNQGAMERFLADGERMAEIDAITGAQVPAMVLGIEVARNNYRDPEGFYRPMRSFSPNDRYTLSVLPLSKRGVAIQLEDRSFPVANEYRSGMYEVDSKWVFVPFDILQGMLKLDEAKRLPADFRPGRVVTGPDGLPTIATPEATETVPARATNILIRASEAHTAREAEAAAEAVYASFADRHDGYPTPPFWEEDFVYVWEDKPDLKGFISAVKKETGLVLVLFVFISFTAVFLVGAIFWSMVSEKTKDIGILRAVGAKRGGVAWLFVRYGLAIGIVGSIVGGILAWLIVTNINPIHQWMGETLGLSIWDPSVYYFTEIPSRVEPSKAVIVLGGGVLFSALGALIPAVRAASMNPVKALRFE